ncbi:MAG TPA: Tex-like N-terminal domain-containing protein, partial [Bacteroidia bacterium]|nr:Tex-like N-terminal domain-containing protein [Bacteroidia bacterium]
MLEKMFFKKIALQLSITEKQVEATVTLLDEGATIPFISRYRKEVTGSLDEVQVANVRDEIERLRALEKRREVIIESIEGQGKLTPELIEQLRAAETMAQLEDIYLPYKPKRRTRATIAREKGLEPLAEILFKQQKVDLKAEAAHYISEEKAVKSAEEALEGARDIVAEWINENAEARESIRNLFKQSATIKSKVLKGKEEQGEKFKDYFEWEERLMTCPSHRLLAIRRGESEGVLSIEIAPAEADALEILRKQFLT